MGRATPTSLRAGGRGFVVYRDLGGLEGADLDDLIARQVRVFAERGERFEWKLHGHDRPPDLPRRLRAAGLVPEDEETVVIAPVDEVAGPLGLAERVSLREVTERSDFDRIAAVQPDIWQEDAEPTWLAASLEEEKRADPHYLTVVVAEADRAVVCAGWVRFEQGTDFATLWGGGRCRRGAGAGSTEQRSRTGQTWPPSAGSASSRSTPPATAARSLSVSDS